MTSRDPADGQCMCSYQVIDVINVLIPNMVETFPC